MTNTCVLVVEDEPINRELLLENLSEHGYATVSAEGGEEAWRLIEETPERFDVVLLDRLMPDMDGIEVLRRIRTTPSLQHTPVIMQTALAAEADIAEGLNAGAYYYLTKPFTAEALLAIVAAAAKDHHQHLELEAESRKTASSVACLYRAEFRFKTPEEARNLATMVAHGAPEPGRIVLGLSELMLNAVEHGNLAITYDEKSALIKDDALFEEVARRLALPEYSSKFAILEFEKDDKEVRFVIRDQGKGFDWKSYLEITPDRAFDTHGRGIAMARMLSFDSLEFEGSGNVVRAVVKAN